MNPWRHAVRGQEPPATTGDLPVAQASTRGDDP